MPEKDHIKSINDNLTIIEATQKTENDINFTLLKKLVSYQLKKINKNNIILNKNIETTKNNIKKLYKIQKFRTQKLILTEIDSVADNKCIKKFLNSVKILFLNSKKLLKSIKYKFINLLKKSLDIFSSVKTFIFDKLQSTFSVMNKLLFGIPGKVWAMTTYLFKTAYKIAGWTLKLGKIAIEFIWSGVKTIFNAGFNVVTTSIQYLSKGTKVFFTWWFRMLIKTMFNPAMWIINLPLFAAITVVAFSAFSIILVASASIILPIFEATFNILTTVGSWIVKSISWIFNWINDQYQGSWLQLSVIDPLLQTASSYIPISIKNAYYTIKDWVTTSINWISNNGDAIFDRINIFISDFKKIEGKTLFQKFLNTFVNLKWGPFFVLPNSLRKMIKSRYGFIMLDSGNLQHQIKTTINTAEISLVSKVAELQYGILEDKGLSADEIFEKIQKEIIPQLTSTIVTSISSEDIEKSIKAGITSAQGTSQINKQYNKRDILDENIISRDIENLKQLKHKKTQMESGSLDASIPEIVKTTQQFINDRNSAISVANYISKTTTNNFDKISAQLQNVKKSLDTSSVLASMSVIDANFDQINTTFGIIHRTANLIVDTGKHNYGEEDHALTVQADISAKLPTSFVPKAHGDIIIPNKSEMNKTIALDNRGIDFIRKKVKEIIPPKDENTNQNNKGSNITIIEEHNNYIESYELYTMNQLSQGILRN